MNLLKNMDDWNRGLFLLICAFILFMLFFHMKSISNGLTEGLMNMEP
jgi:hypothetical protein